MQSGSTSPSSVLRSHDRAVILTAANGVVTPEVQRAISDSGASVQLISRPLSAMAALVALEKSAQSAPTRPLLVIADRDIGDLDPLFSSVRSRLPRVAIWVFERNITVRLCAGIESRADQPKTEARASSSASEPSRPRFAPTKPPQLRIAHSDEEVSDALEVERALDASAQARDGELDEEPLGASGSAVTAEEYAMLLELLQPPPNRGADSGGDA